MLLTFLRLDDPSIGFVAVPYFLLTYGDALELAGERPKGKNGELTGCGGITGGTV